MSATPAQSADPATKLTLRLFLLAHPQSQSAHQLALELMRRFVDPPGRGGLRVSVRLTPHNTAGLPPDPQQLVNGPLAASQHALVIVLGDDVMATEAFGGTAQHWRRFIAETRTLLNQTPQQHLLLGIALEESAFSLDPGHNQIRLPQPPQASADSPEFRSWLSTAADTAALHIALHAVSLLNPAASAAHDANQRPFRLFLSHAKRDLAAVGDEQQQATDPVRQVQTHLQNLPIGDWFDARDIRGGRDFAAEIRTGIRNCSVVIAFLTDHYSGRPWCLEEILHTKTSAPRSPLIVVDALESGETRSFPWLGNTPVVVWKPAQPAVSVNTILWQAVRETLRFLLNTQQLQQIAANLPDSEQLDLLPTAPEPADLTQLPALPDRRRRILYPDPPLMLSELRLLQALQNADYCTPLGLLARRASRLRGQAIAVSVSESDELQKIGFTPLHEQDFTDEIHLSLLLAGLRILYGGRLETPAEARGRNFTLRLLDLVRNYSELAGNLEATLQPIHNLAPWPLFLTYQSPAFDHKTLSLLNGVATVECGPVPDSTEIPTRMADGQPLFPLEQSPFTLPDLPLRRLAWTRGLSMMRQKSTVDSSARIVMGGKLKGFSGLYPGIIEEAWWSIRLQKPLFLLGALQGAAAAVIDLLENRPRIDLQHSCSPETSTQTRSVLQVAGERGLQCGPLDPGTDPQSLSGRLLDPLAMLNDLQQAGRQGPAAALNNGLTDEENRLLFQADEPQTAVRLILSGLERIGKQAAR